MTLVLCHMDRHCRYHSSNGSVQLAFTVLHQEGLVDKQFARCTQGAREGTAGGSRALTGRAHFSPGTSVVGIPHREQQSKPQHLTPPCVLLLAGLRVLLQVQAE